jgi:hypothetical protein
MNLETFILISAVGFLASYAHLMIGLWAHRIGLPRLNLAMAMSHLSLGPEEQEPSPHWVGLAVVQLNGILFALLYGGLVGAYLPGLPVVRGLIWAGVLLLTSQMFFVPVFLKEGVFLSKLHRRAWITAAMCHAIYGAVLGWLCPVVV